MGRSSIESYQFVGWARPTIFGQPLQTVGRTGEKSIAHGLVSWALPGLRTSNETPLGLGLLAVLDVKLLDVAPEAHRQFRDGQIYRCARLSGRGGLGNRVAGKPLGKDSVVLGFLFGCPEATQVVGFLRRSEERRVGKEC